MTNIYSMSNRFILILPTKPPLLVCFLSTSTSPSVRIPKARNYCPKKIISNMIPVCQKVSLQKVWKAQDNTEKLSQNGYQTHNQFTKKPSNLNSPPSSFLNYISQISKTSNINSSCHPLSQSTCMTSPTNNFSKRLR